MIDDLVKEQAMNMIRSRADNLLRERANVRKQRIDLEHRDRAIDRELADCVAAARVFGMPLELPADPKPESSLNLWAATAAAAQISALSNFVHHYGPSRPPPQRAAIATPAPAVTATLTFPAMPKIKDIVLDRLREARHGTRAADIRHYISDTYGQNIHYKTVGMTLYRLSTDKLVHRVGQIWFFGPASHAEAKNPGAATPGLPQPLAEVGKEA